MKTRTSIYIDIKELEKLKSRAEENGRSISGEVCFILKHVLNGRANDGTSTNLAGGD